MNMLKILSKIKNYVFSGATTLEKFIELCKKDNAPFIDIWDRCYDAFGDLYKIEYESPKRNFCEKIDRVPFRYPEPIFDLKSKKNNIKTLERVLEAAEKIEKAGIKILHREKPINKSKIKETIEYEKEKVRKRESELGLK